jgi:hypothetical protein
VQRRRLIFFAEFTTKVLTERQTLFHTEAVFQTNRYPKDNLCVILSSLPREIWSGFVLCIAGFGLQAATVDIPQSLAVGSPATTGGGSLKGEYWKRPPQGIATDGTTVVSNRIDNQIRRFGPPDGTFKATSFVYLGNDLTTVGTWLGSDGATYSGIASNLDDGAFRMSGFINVPAPGIVNLGVNTDDGARITIGGVDIVANDGSHGDQTVIPTSTFLARASIRLKSPSSTATGRASAMETITRELQTRRSWRREFPAALGRREHHCGTTSQGFSRRIRSRECDVGDATPTRRGAYFTNIVDRVHAGGYVDSAGF